MSLADYYRANANDKSKLYIYIIIGDSTLKMKYKDCGVGVGGKTLDEAKQTLNRITSNPTEEDKIWFALDNKENLRIVKARVKIRDEEVYPICFIGDTDYWVIRDDEMIAYEKELLKV